MNSPETKNNGLLQDPFGYNTPKRINSGGFEAWPEFDLALSAQDQTLFVFFLYLSRKWKYGFGLNRVELML